VQTSLRRKDGVVRIVGIPELCNAFKHTSYKREVEGNLTMAVKWKETGKG
jgi:hypothetical protein